MPCRSGTPSLPELRSRYSRTAAGGPGPAPLPSASHASPSSSHSGSNKHIKWAVPLVVCIVGELRVCVLARVCASPSLVVGMVGDSMSGVLVCGCETLSVGGREEGVGT